MTGLFVVLTAYERCTRLEAGVDVRFIPAAVIFTQYHSAVADLGYFFI